MSGQDMPPRDPSGKYRTVDPREKFPDRYVYDRHEGTGRCKHCGRPAHEHDKKKHFVEGADRWHYHYLCPIDEDEGALDTIARFLPENWMPGRSGDDDENDESDGDDGS
jgi:hypothetical protein